MDDKKLKPGPKLDTAVAERVMGCRIKKNHSYSDRLYGTRPYCILPDGGTCVTAKYSTDWAAAGLVMERLAGLGWSTSILVQNDGKRICHCSYWVEQDDGEMDLVAVTEFFQSDLAPHAICLAALAAMEANG